jgi:hypothetical protein
MLSSHCCGLQLHHNVDAAVHLSFEPKHHADRRGLIRPRQRAAVGGAVHQYPGAVLRNGGEWSFVGWTPPVCSFGSPPRFIAQAAVP